MTNKVPFFTIGVDSHNNAIAVDEHGATIVSLPCESIEELLSHEFQQYITAAVYSTLDISIPDPYREESIILDDDDDDNDASYYDTLWTHFLNQQQQQQRTIDEDFALALKLQEEEETRTRASQQQHNKSTNTKIPSNTKAIPKIANTGWSQVMKSCAITPMTNNLRISSSHTQYNQQEHFFPALQPAQVVAPNNTKTSSTSTTTSTTNTTLAYARNSIASSHCKDYFGNDTKDVMYHGEKNHLPPSPSPLPPSDDSSSTSPLTSFTYISTSPISPQTLEYLKKHAQGDDDIPFELLGYNKSVDVFDDTKEFLNTKDEQIKHAVLDRAVFYAEKEKEERRKNRASSKEDLCKMMNSTSVSQCTTTTTTTTTTMYHDNNILDAAAAYTTRERDYCRKNIRKLVMDMIDAGWRPIPGRGGGHYMYQRDILPMNHKQLIVLPHTPSDVNSIHNVHARLQKLDREAAEMKKKFVESRE